MQAQAQAPRERLQGLPPRLQGAAAGAGAYRGQGRLGFLAGRHVIQGLAGHHVLPQLHQTGCHSADRRPTAWVRVCAGAHNVLYKCKGTLL